MDHPTVAPRREVGHDSRSRVVALLCSRHQSSHRASHHIVMDAHDVGPVRKFQKGRMVTTEPAISISQEGFGIRFEERGVVTARGAAGCLRYFPRISKGWRVVICEWVPEGAVRWHRSQLRSHRVSEGDDSVPAMKKAGRGVHSPGASGSRGPMPLRSTNFEEF